MINFSFVSASFLYPFASNPLRGALPMQINQSSRDYRITGGKSQMHRQISSRASQKKVSLFDLWQIFVGELSLLLNLAIIKIFLLFFFWWASSLKNTLATRMHHLAEGAFPRFAMKQKPHSRNKFKSSTWIMDFLLPSLFVSLWNFYAPQKTSHKLIFLPFTTGFDFLFNSLRPLSRFSRVSRPRSVNRLIRSILQSRLANGFLENFNQNSLSVQQNCVLKPLGALIFATHVLFQPLFFYQWWKFFLHTAEKSSKGWWCSSCPTQARYLCATSRQ